MVPSNPRFGIRDVPTLYHLNKWKWGSIPPLLIDEIPFPYLIVIHAYLSNHEVL